MSGQVARVGLGGDGSGHSPGDAEAVRPWAQRRRTGGAPRRKAPGDGGAEGGDRVTIEANATTVTIERLGGASFLNLQTDRAGHAAIRTGTCGSRGKVAFDLGEFSTFLASEVAIDFDELTGGSYVLTIDDVFCVELQQK